jgi:hypothetical protein
MFNHVQRTTKSDNETAYAIYMYDDRTQEMNE